MVFLLKKKYFMLFKIVVGREERKKKSKINRLFVYYNKKFEYVIFVYGILERLGKYIFNKIYFCVF